MKFSISNYPFPICRVELDAFPAEFTALKLIQKGMDDKSREVSGGDWSL